VLGILLAIASSKANTTSTRRTEGTSHPSALSTSSNSAVITQQATVIACQSDYQSVDRALQLYEAFAAGKPPTGQSWATSTTSGGPYLQEWPSNPAYEITWDGSNLDVVPVHGAPSRGSPGTPTPPTGCYGS
jgi:hypothetical protein